MGTSKRKETEKKELRAHPLGFRRWRNSPLRVKTYKLIIKETNPSSCFLFFFVFIGLLNLWGYSRFHAVVTVQYKWMNTWPPVSIWVGGHVIHHFLLDSRQFRTHGCYSRHNVLCSFIIFGKWRESIHEHELSWPYISLSLTQSRTRKIQRNKENSGTEK